MLNRKSLIALALLAAVAPVRAESTAHNKVDGHQSWDDSGVHVVSLDASVLARDLDWLAADLAKTKGQPIVIGLARGIDNSDKQLTQNDAFLKVIRPYNVRFLLIGEGESEKRWNVEGITTVMSKEPFRRGYYPLVQKNKEELALVRRVVGSSNLLPVTSTTLTRPTSPNFLIHAHVENNKGVVTVGTGQLPEPLPQSARLSFRVDGGKALPIRTAPWGWTGEFDATELAAGGHRVEVLAELPDGRQYRLGLDLTLS